MCLFLCGDDEQLGHAKRTLVTMKETFLNSFVPYQMYKSLIKSMGRTKQQLENMEPIEEIPQEVYFSGATFNPEYFNTWCGTTVNTIDEQSIPKEDLVEKLNNKLKQLEQ